MGYTAVACAHRTSGGSGRTSPGASTPSHADPGSTETTTCSPPPALATSVPWPAVCIRRMRSIGGTNVISSGSALGATPSARPRNRRSRPKDTAASSTSGTPTTPWTSAYVRIRSGFPLATRSRPTDRPAIGTPCGSTIRTGRTGTATQSGAISGSAPTVTVARYSRPSRTW
jgi:hypothetical protein